MTHTTALFGAIHYEFRMQIRRPVVWILILCVGVLAAAWFTGVGKPDDRAADLAARLQTNWQFTCN
ncbi:MAG TPA: hypothetical protein VGK81_04995 [Anaerolineae bacterium]